MAIKKIEIRDKESNYQDILYPKTSIDMVDNLQIELNNRALSNHTHTKLQITDFPTSLPANGGNADTVDGKHASDFVDITKFNEAIAQLNRFPQLTGGSISATINNYISQGKYSGCFVILNCPEFPLSSGWDCLCVFRGMATTIQLEVYRAYTIEPYINQMVYNQTIDISKWVQIATVNSTVENATTLNGRYIEEFALFNDYKEIDFLDDYSRMATIGLSGNGYDVNIVSEGPDGLQLNSYNGFNFYNGNINLRGVSNTVYIRGNEVYHDGRKPTKADIGLSNVANYGVTTAVNSTSTTTYATASAVKQAYDRAEAAFQSASSGKTAIANAITAKGVPASGSDTHATLANKIGQIPKANYPTTLPTGNNYSTSISLYWRSISLGGSTTTVKFACGVLLNNTTYSISCTTGWSYRQSYNDPVYVSANTIVRLNFAYIYCAEGGTFTFSSGSGNTLPILF